MTGFFGLSGRWVCSTWHRWGQLGAHFWDWSWAGPRPGARVGCVPVPLSSALQAPVRPGPLGGGGRQWCMRAEAAAPQPHGACFPLRGRNLELGRMRCVVAHKEGTASLRNHPVPILAQL